MFESLVGRAREHGVSRERMHSCMSCLLGGILVEGLERHLVIAVCAERKRRFCTSWFEFRINAWKRSKNVNAFSTISLEVVCLVTAAASGIHRCAVVKESKNSVFG